MFSKLLELVKGKLGRAAQLDVAFDSPIPACQDARPIHTIGCPVPRLRRPHGGNAYQRRQWRRALQQAWFHEIPRA